MPDQTPSPPTTVEVRPSGFAGCRSFPIPVHDRRAFEALTHREREVLTLLGAGLSNRQIARRMDVKERTVKAHLTQVLEKLPARSRLEAALIVITDHWNRYHRSGEADCAGVALLDPGRQERTVPPAGPTVGGRGADAEETERRRAG